MRCYACNAPIKGAEVFGDDGMWCDEDWFHLLDLRVELRNIETDIRGLPWGDALETAKADRQIVLGHIERFYRFAPQTGEVRT